MRADAQAQPNIALIKYWGKRDAERNLPAVGSLSMTLLSLQTRMSVEFDDTLDRDRLEVNGEAGDAMLQRVSRCLDAVAGKDRPRAAVRSTSNFPIAAGLASSASAFAALVVAADGAQGSSRDTIALARLAGHSSGSAARSLFGGFVELSAQEDGIDAGAILAPADWPVEIVIAVTEESAKPLGSGEAMTRSAASSPFYASWVERQEDDLAAAREAIAARDFGKLAAISEHNCLKMHSLTWTSRPPVVYWNEGTLACMQTVRELQSVGHAVFFTIDAGPQLKAVCLPDAAASVRDALDATPGVTRTMQSSLGPGARLLQA